MQRTLSEILGGGSGGAAKYRDHVGKVVTITRLATVRTRNGEAIQFETEELGHVWAPSIVAQQLADLDEEGYLPGRFVLSQATSAAGKDYFVLEAADA
jgi:hypothetical protein